MMSEQLDAIQTNAAAIPKYPAPALSTSSSVSRSLLSLLLYLAAGFWLFGNLSTLLLITFVLLLHEAGHFLAMRMTGYRDLGIFFIPLIGAYVSGSKRSVTQRESAIVTLAGPLPGLLTGIVLWYFIQTGYAPNVWMEIDLKQLVLFLVVLNGMNLLPIYPLDGGQLMNRVFLDEDGWGSRIFVIASALLLSMLAIKFRIYPLLIFPFLLLLRLYRSPVSKRIETRIAQAGINTEIEYAELPDVDYWRIRSILLEEHPAFQNRVGDYSNTYSPDEERIRQAVEGQLHRTLVQDLSVPAKFLIAILWLAGLLAPLLIWLR